MQPMRVLNSNDRKLQSLYAQRESRSAKGTYNVWVSKYGHIAGVAFTITGEMKSNMWYVLPTISKCWL